MLNKFINAFPCNSNVLPGNVTLSCALPNDETAGFACAEIIKLSNGEVIDSVYKEYTTPTNEFAFTTTSRVQSGEYSWSVFCWNEIANDAKHYAYQVIGYDEDTNVLCVWANTKDINYGDTGSARGFGVSENGADFYKDENSPSTLDNNVLKEAVAKGYVLEVVSETGTKFYCEPNKSGHSTTYSSVSFDSNIASSLFYKKRIQDSTLDSQLSSTHCDIKLYEKSAFESNFSGRLLYYNNKYYYVKNSSFHGYYFCLTLMPIVKTANEFTISDTIKIYDNSVSDYSISQPYYFSVKPHPTFTISSDDIISEVIYKKSIMVNIEYTSDICKLDYYHTYLFAYDDKKDSWILKQSSPLTKAGTKEISFDGLVQGQLYKIYADGYDVDGTRWSTNELNFTPQYEMVSNIDIPIRFNQKDTSIDIFLDNLIEKYKQIRVQFYKMIDNDTVMSLEQASPILYLKGIDNIVGFNKFRDYNIKNNCRYRYYINVLYEGINFDDYGNKLENDTTHGEILIDISQEITTDFSGTSLLGLKGDAIFYSFNLFYHISDEPNNYSIKTNKKYLHGFNRYPKELKGYQKYITGQCSGLLGNDCNSVYKEPQKIKNDWIDFVDSDTIKLFRGINGENMIISIEESEIKPLIYNGGIANEVFATYNQIASSEDYLVYQTEFAGDENDTY